MRTAHLKSGTGVGKGRRAGQPFRACGSQEEVDEADEKEASSSGLGREAARVLRRWTLPLLSAGLGLPGTSGQGFPFTWGHVGKKLRNETCSCLFIPNITQEGGMLGKEVRLS